MRFVSPTLKRLLLALGCLAAFASNASAQHRHLVGGSGSSHKGGHYVHTPDSSPTPHSHSYSSHSHSYSHSYTPHASHSHGHYHRSEAAKHQFERMTGHPGGWPGHVVDHIKPLACGGADAPSNMQWQTTADAKAKDKWERTGCH